MSQKERAIKLVDMLGPCTDDVVDCEIRLLTLAVKDSPPDSARARPIMQELARAVCQYCIDQYLPDEGYIR